jgi:hypothetical protein
MVAVTLPENPADLARAIALIATSQLPELHDEWEQHAAEHEVFEEQAKLMWAREVLRLLDLEIAKRAGTQDEAPKTGPKARHFSVTTKNGNVTFESTLTDQEAREWCKNSTSEFGRKIANRRRNSDVEMAWMHKLAIDANKPKPTPSASEWIGTVGQKWKGGVTVRSMVRRQGSYGPQTIVKMTFGDNELTWFASGHEFDFAEESVIHIEGTIKAHDTFRGTKQTILTRVKKI